MYRPVKRKKLFARHVMVSVMVVLVLVTVLLGPLSSRVSSYCYYSLIAVMLTSVKLVAMLKSKLVWMAYIVGLPCHKAGTFVPL